MTSLRSPAPLGATPRQVLPTLLVAAVIMLAIGPFVIWAWPLPALLVVTPLVVAAVLIAVGTPASMDHGARIALVALTAVLPLSPGVLGVGDLVEAAPDAWIWRLSLVLPIAASAIVVDPVTVARLFRRPVVWWFVIAGWALIAAPGGASPGTSALAALELAGLGVAAGWATTRVRPRAALKLAGAGAGTFCLVSVVVDLSGVEIPTIFGRTGSTGLGFTRVVGLAGEPIQLAETAGIAVVCMMAVASTVRFRRLSTTDWVIIGIGVATIVGSQSRAALAALVAAWGWMVLRRRASTAVLAGAAIAGIVVIVVVLSGVGPTVVTDLVDLRDDSAGSNGRIESVWPATIDKIAERPITGWGVTGAEVAMRQQMEAGEVPFILARSAHNRFLEGALALGVIGLVLLAVFAVELASVVRSPGLEAILVYIVVAGLTGPGSGAAYASADEIVLVVVATVLIGAGSEQEGTKPSPGDFLDRQLFG